MRAWYSEQKTSACEESSIQGGVTLYPVHATSILLHIRLIGHLPTQGMWDTQLETKSMSLQKKNCKESVCATHLHKGNVFAKNTLAIEEVSQLKKRLHKFVSKKRQKRSCKQISADTKSQKICMCKNTLAKISVCKDALANKYLQKGNGKKYICAKNTCNRRRVFAKTRTN